MTIKKLGGSLMKFTFENSGGNTYLVYEINNEVEIDAICMGMVTNNDIEGILPFIFTQMDSKRYLKYNISSKITLERFLASTVLIRGKGSSAIFHHHFKVQCR